jgi:hypothetical protein
LIRIFQSMIDFFKARRSIFKVRVRRAILAPCGFRCDLCPAFSENVTSLFQQQRISQGWEKYLRMKVEPQDVVCGGCIYKGKVIDRHCPVRPCVRKQNVNNCGECTHFICGKLKPRIEMVEEIRKEYSEISKRDYRMFIRPYESRKRLMELRKKK